MSFLLQQQLADKTVQYLHDQRCTQRELAREIGATEQQVCDFLKARRSLGATATTNLATLLSSHTSQLLHFQQNHTHANFDEEPTVYRSKDIRKQLSQDGGDGWVPGLSGDDPNSAAAGEPTIGDVLSRLNQLYSVLTGGRPWVSGPRTVPTPVQRAESNPDGSTEAPHVVASNAQSRGPGPLNDLI
jgi:plasmid maintenance system antidote protein VapI